jgi:hypothetical protein
MGTLPAALTNLTSQVSNGLNQAAGPFMSNVPTPPPGGSPGWAGYGYTPNANGTFTITVTGDGTTITLP